MAEASRELQHALLDPRHRHEYQTDGRHVSWTSNDRTVALFGRGSKEELLIRVVAAQTHELSSGGASAVTIGNVSHFLAHAMQLRALASY